MSKPSKRQRDLAYVSRKLVVLEQCLEALRPYNDVYILEIKRILGCEIDTQQEVLRLDRINQGKPE